MAKKSLLDPVKEQEEDKSLETALRPKSFDEFPGQEEIKKQLKIFVTAALEREEPLDHTLLYGPPGLGKTTLARIIAETMGVEFAPTSGPAIRRKGDLAALLTTIKEKSVLFIDEIHRLSSDLEEYLYSAMEDFFIDIITGEGLGANSVRFHVNPFTLIGATTRTGLLKAPFRDRFGIIQRLDFYDNSSLCSIVERSAKLLNVSLTPSASLEIAKRSRGTPRIVNRLLRRVRDYAQVKSNQIKPNQTKPNQTKSNQIKPNQIKPNQTKPNQTKPNQTKPNQTKSNQTKSNQTKSNQIKSNQIKSNQTKPNQTKSKKTVDQDLACYALNELGINEMGLTKLDRDFLKILYHDFGEHPVGIETLSSNLSEEVETLEDFHEPYLLREGFIRKTPRGRVLTKKGQSFIAATVGKKQKEQEELF